MNNQLSLWIVLFLLFFSSYGRAQTNLLRKLKSPIIFKGDDSIAYRDPAVLYENNRFYLFFTLVKTEEGKIFSYTAMSDSKDLKHWNPVKVITPKDQSLDYCSPGNIVRYKGEWVMCLQSYPRPDYSANQPPRYGNGDCRLFLMRSKNLVNWSVPGIIKVKGPDVKIADMGRMIDPYLLEDKDVKGKWWCFYKQNGVSMSFSYDLVNWSYFGHTESGENVTVLIENNDYILIHSPSNGIAIKRSPDLKNWKDWGKLITLGQSEWEWAKGRITAGTVINLKGNKKLGKYVMFFHGSGPKTEQEGDFDRNASIGIAWSDDLVNWEWPGKKK